VVERETIFRALVEDPVDPAAIDRAVRSALESSVA
jgi:hypothetical protein